MDIKWKLKTNSLKIKVFIYLGIFSLLILVFLWFFQVVSLNKFYEWSKRRELGTIASKIVEKYQDDDFFDIIDEISYKYNVCIELFSNNKYSYISYSNDRFCISDNNTIINKYKYEFSISNELIKTYYFENKFGNNIMMKSIKLDNNVYLFINSPLAFVDSTKDVLKSQFVIVSMIVLILSFIVGYFISKKISKPIIKINEIAKDLGLRNYDLEFKVEENIHEINELVNTLNYARIELSKTEMLRRELMANVSHDLKTPLTMIKAYAEMVRDLTYNNKEKREDNLNVIINEADRLNILVDDMLTIAKLENNRDNLNISEFDLNVLLQSVIKSYDIYIEKDNYNIIYNGLLKAMVKADAEKIKQVLYNLINNAINYTVLDKTIIINLVKIDDKYRVSICDTGSGISKKDIKYIWDKYYKADKSHSRVMVGSGIGLSIVKTILEHHNFNYGVISKKNKGTTFYFDI